MHIAGKFLKHAVGVLLLCWRRVLKTAAVISVVAFLAVEILSMVVTHSFPPPSTAHLVACAFALAIAYGAAMTVFLDELVVGMIESVAVLEGDVAAGTRSAAIAAEREISDLRAGLGHWFGRRDDPVEALSRVAVSVPVAAAAAALGSSIRASRHVSAEPAPHSDEEHMLVAEESEPGADTSDGEDDNTLRAVLDPPIPPLPMQQQWPQPVRADQLPRIQWATETESTTEPSLPAPPSLPSLPRMVPVRTVPLADAADDTPIEPDAGAGDTDQTLDELADDQVVVMGESVASPEQPSAAGAVGEPDSATAEVPSVQSPSDDARPAGGVWQRLSQVLSGVSPAITLPGTSAPRDEATEEPDERDG